MTAELESIHSSTRANISTANLPFFLIFFYAAAAAAAGVFPVGVQSPNRVYTLSPFHVFFPFIADVTATYARDVNNVCRKKGFVCVYPAWCGWAYTVYTAVPHQHQSSMDSYRHRTPSPPLRLLRAAIRRVRLIDIRINTRPAHSTGGQTSGQLRERETLMTRQHPAQLTVLHHHRFFWGDFYFGEFFF